MRYQSLTAVNQTGLLIGRDKVTQLNRPEGSMPIALDDWQTAVKVLPDEAIATARQNAQPIKETFLADQAPRLVPMA